MTDIVQHWLRGAPQQDKPEAGYLPPPQWETDQLSICQEQQPSAPQETQHSQWVPEMPLIPIHTEVKGVNREWLHSVTIRATQHFTINLLYTSNVQQCILLQKKMLLVHDPSWSKSLCVFLLFNRNSLVHQEPELKTVRYCIVLFSFFTAVCGCYLYVFCVTHSFASMTKHTIKLWLTT